MYVMGTQVGLVLRNGVSVTEREDLGRECIHMHSAPVILCVLDMGMRGGFDCTW